MTDKDYFPKTMPREERIAQAACVVSLLERFVKIGYVAETWAPLITVNACLFVESVVISLYLDGIDVRADSNKSVNALHTRVLVVSSAAMKREIASRSIDG